MPVALARLAGPAVFVACLAGLAHAQESRVAIEELVFTGNPGLREADLDREVRSHYGGLPPASRVAEVPETVRRILVGEGFRRATVSGVTERVGSPERTRLVIKVDAGPRTIIASVQVTGTSPLSRERILARSGAVVNGPFREREIARNLADIRADLRKSTYYKAIAIPLYEFLDDEQRVNLTLQVDAGPRVRIQYLPDRSHLPSGNIEDFIPITQEHSVDVDLLDDAVRAIEDGLRLEGYWKAVARHRQSPEQADVLVVTFEIERGRRYRIDHIDVPPGLQVSRQVLEAEPGLKPGEWFSAERATVAIRRVLARVYWDAGYHQATFLPAFKEAEDPPGRTAEVGRVIVSPAFTEGARASIRSVTFDLGPSPRVSEIQLRGQMRSRPGGPYSALTTFIDRQTLVDYYTELGFLAAEAKIDTTFNDDETQVTLAVYAREGPQIRVGRIEVVGNRTVKPEAILQEISLRSGEPYSEARRLESQRRIYELGSFRNVSVTLDDRAPNDTVQNITISVAEAPATTVGSGGGVEMAKRTRTTETGEEDRVEFSPRAFLEVTRRNLGGMNRSLSFFGRVSLQPTNAPGDPTRDGKGFGFSEYRVTTTYRERYAFGTNTDILAGASSEQGVRPTFSFIEQRFNADLVRQIRRGMAVSARYALEFNELFDERIPPEDQPDIDRLFPQVRLSIVSSGFAFDRRNDPVAPSKGTLVAGTVDFALRPLGSEIGYVKTLMQGIHFIPLTERGRVVLALRGELGLAHGFEREVEQLDENGNPVLGPDGQPVVDVVADLPASQRFYAGGSTTVRGFGVDRLGVREVLTDEGLSNGGNGMVVMNAELRVIAGNLFGRPATVVGFLDGGNVFQMASDVDFSRLRGTFGFGMRWDSPVGPLRLDWGRKMSQMIFKGGAESRSEWHFSLGHAF